MRRCLVRHLFAALVLVSSVRADPAVDFIGQFGDKAVVRIDGRQQLLGVGETSREGVTLLKLGADHALIEYRGNRRQVGYAAPGSSPYKKPAAAEVTIWADSRGHFVTPGTINGQLVSLLVDTGATTVAMSEVMARKLGIDFRYSGTPTTVVTASGMVPAHQVKLDSVRVGEIELRGVEGTVVEGGFPVQILLGMSFLSRVEIERKQNLIRLTRTR